MSMAQDLFTLVTNFKPEMGELDCFCTIVARSQGKTCRIHFAAAILEMQLETQLMGVIVTVR